MALTVKLYRYHGWKPVVTGFMIIGHRRSLRYLDQVLAKGTLAHAYLFHGPEAVGKKTVALTLTKALLCGEGFRRLGGCGRCGDCRAVETLAHPDLFFLAPEHLMVEEKNKRDIGIKNAQELRRRLAQSAWRSGSGKRVCVIDGADSLSRDAQAALLKTLEEPGKNIFFIFITSSPAALLDTIRSRSVSLGFSFVSDEEMLPLLADVPPARRSPLLALASGQPGILVRLVADSVFRATMVQENAAFDQVLAGDLIDQFRLGDREAAEAGGLESLLLFLVGRLRRELFSSLAVNPAATELRTQLAPRAEFLGSLLSKLSLLRAAALNRRLLTDSVFVELQALAMPAGKEI